MKKRVYTILVDHFKKWGVTHVFGIPGKSISPIMLEVDNQEITYILSRHEAGAGFEAAGYALTNKKLGVAIATSGPGGTNLLTAAGQAKAFHLPVLLLTGHPSMQDTGKGLGQDSSFFGTDLVKMFEPVTLFSARVERGDLLCIYLRHALEKAFSGSKGPVHLCIPFDVLFEEIEPFELPLPTGIQPMVSPNVEAMIPLLDNAQKPVLFLGKGVAITEAYQEVQILAEHWHIPVITTPGGKGVFPTNHPLSLGGFGLGGTMEASEYLKSGIDLMIVIGSKLSDMSLSGFTSDMYPKQVIHLDYELTFIGKSISVQTLGILGDAKQNLKTLIELTNASLNEKEYSSRTTSTQIGNASSIPLSAVMAIKTLRECLFPDAILIGDDGSHTFYAIRHFDIYETGTFYFDDVFGSMGHAIGYAIGAKIGAPDKTIACLTGDGCVMMYGTEISTAVNHHVPVFFIVLNNGRLDMVDKGMSRNTGHSVGAIYETPLHVTDFAKSMGAYAYRCNTEKDIIEAVRQAYLHRDGPTVIEIMVDPLEIPPILTRLLSID